MLSIERGLFTKQISREIRPIKENDTPAISDLLRQLGCQGVADFLSGKIHSLIADPAEYCPVAEERDG